MRRRPASVGELQGAPPEALWQTLLVAWCQSQRWKRPGLETIFHVPNFRHLPGTRRARAAQVGALRSQGFTDGVADLLLLFPRGPWHGAVLELKARGRKPTAAQVRWLRITESAGFACACLDNFDDATQWLMCYYDRPFELKTRFPLAEDFRLRERSARRAPGMGRVT